MRDNERNSSSREEQNAQKELIAIFRNSFNNLRELELLFCFLKPQDRQEFRQEGDPKRKKKQPLCEMRDNNAQERKNPKSNKKNRAKDNLPNQKKPKETNCDFSQFA